MKSKTLLIIIFILIPFINACVNFNSSGSNSTSYEGSFSTGSIVSSVSTTKIPNIVNSSKFNFDDCSAIEVETYVYKDYAFAGILKSDFNMDQIYNNLGLEEDGCFFIIDDMQSWLTVYTSITMACYDMPPEEEFNKNYIYDVKLVIRRTASSPNRIKANYFYDHANHRLIVDEENLNNSDLCVEVECIDIITISKDELITFYPGYINKITHMETVYHSSNREFDIVNKPGDYQSQFGTYLPYEDIIYEGSLQELFNTPYNDEVIKEYFIPVFDVRRENISTSLHEQIDFKDLFLDGYNIYATRVYNCNKNEPGDDAITSYDHLFLIPNAWKEKINRVSYANMIFNSHYLDVKDDVLCYKNLYDIKVAYLYEFYNDNYYNATIKDIYISQAVKEFENATAVKIGCTLFDYPDVCWEEIVGGYTIYYGNGNRIQIYSNHKLYLIQEAYDLGIITLDDVAYISRFTQ